MSNEIAIKVSGLSKVYQLSEPAMNNETGILSNELHALKNVNFEIKRGESIGIIGPNGSGKSTLLKILAGVTRPTSGTVEIYGRVASILDIGAGFNPELSGRDNVFLNGQILGFSKKEIKEKFGEIVAFSGIEKFIDQPVKTYSNGMYLRLAFSIVIHLDFDIYLFDEVMSVGDAEFRQKSSEAIKNRILQNNKTILLISHNLSDVVSICSKVFLLEKGHLDTDIDEEQALLKYKKTETATKSNNPDFVKFLSVEVYGNSETNSNVFLNSQSLRVVVTNEFKDLKSSYLIGLRFIDRLGNVVFNTSPALNTEGINSENLLTSDNLTLKIPGYFFNKGIFFIDVVYFTPDNLMAEVKNATYFEIKLNQELEKQSIYGESGPVKPYFEWII